MDYEPSIGEAGVGASEMRAEIERVVRSELGDLIRAEIRAATRTNVQERPETRGDVSRDANSGDSVRSGVAIGGDDVMRGDDAIPAGGGGSRRGYGDGAYGSFLQGVRDRSGHRAGPEILEPFNPDDRDANAVRWLAKMDQLGEVHAWSGYERASFLQAKLKGAARDWFNNLASYD